MIELEKTTCIRGDETASYSVKITKQNVSLREFIDSLLTERRREWSHVKIQDNDDPWFGYTFAVEYRWGKIVSDNIPENLMDKSIPSKILGNGGWSMMDYYIKLEDLK